MGWVRNFDLRFAICDLRFLSCQKAVSLAGHDQFFVGGDDHDLDPGVRGADDGFGRAGGGVFIGVEDDAELVKIADHLGLPSPK